MESGLRDKVVLITGVGSGICRSTALAFADEGSNLALLDLDRSTVINLDESNFDQTMSSSNVPVLVEFWATWAGPSRTIAPVLDEIASEHGDKVRVAKVDVDNNPALSNRFEIRNIPTFLIFKSGEVSVAKSAPPIDPRSPITLRLAFVDPVGRSSGVTTITVP